MTIFHTVAPNATEVELRIETCGISIDLRVEDPIPRVGETIYCNFKTATVTRVSYSYYEYNGLFKCKIEIFASTTA